MGAAERRIRWLRTGKTKWKSEEEIKDQDWKAKKIGYGVQVTDTGQ